MGRTQCVVPTAGFAERTLSATGRLVVLVMAYTTSARRRGRAEAGQFALASSGGAIVPPWPGRPRRTENASLTSRYNQGESPTRTGVMLV